MLLDDDYTRMIGVFASQEEIRSIWKLQGIQGNGWKWNGFKNQMFEIW